MGKRLKWILPILVIILLASTAGVLAFTDASGWLLTLPKHIVAALSSPSTEASASAAHATLPGQSAEAVPSVLPSQSAEAAPGSGPSTASATPEASPSASPSATPEASPSATPKASPSVTPEASPHVSTAASPVSSPSPSASDTPAAIPADPQTAGATTGPSLTLSVTSMRQGDVVAVWLDDVPERLADADIRFRASWLKNPVPAHRWGNRLVALIQATISVNPNTYSVRAVTIATDAAGAALAPVEIEGTRRLIRIEKRAFEQQIFSVSKELEQTRSDTNLAADAEKVSKAKSNPSIVPIWEAAFQMPIEGGVAKAFGKQRIINGKLNYTHSGVDVSAKEGTPIHAPAAGRVVFSGALIVSGNTVILDHGLGMFSSLVHMSKTAATVGQEVAAGEVVGYVGETGFATGPHLHWTLSVHGNSVDPEYLMRIDPLQAIRPDAAAK